MAIRLNNTFALSMYTLDNNEENRFKQICPVLIDTAVRAGTKLQVYDKGIERTHGIIVD